MKKLLYVFLALTMALTMVACPDSPNNGGGDPPVVTSVTIVGDIVVIRGTPKTYTATVVGTNGGSDTAVTWSIVETGIDATFVGGVLTVDEAEAATSITIKATSNVTPTVSDELEVFLFDDGDEPEATSVTISSAGDVEVVKKGETLQFSAAVAGTGVGTAPFNEVTWDIDNAGPGTTISATGLLTVAANEVTLVELTIIAASKVTNTVFDEFVVTVITETPGPNPNLVEILALENASQAIYKFELPTGMTFGDFVGLSAEFKLEDPAVAAGADNGGVQIRAFRLYGNFKAADFITEDGPTGGKIPLNAHVVKFGSDNSNGTDYLARDGGGAWSYDYTTVGWESGGDWWTKEFDFPANYGGGSIDKGHWPDADDEGPFYFGIGLSGTSGNHIVQSIRNVKLIVKPELVAFGYGDLYSEGDGFTDGKPGFAGYAPYPKEASVYRGTTLPAIVKFNWQGHGDKPAAHFVTPASTYEQLIAELDELQVLGKSNNGTPENTADDYVISMAEPEVAGWIFGGWFKEAGCTTEFTNADTFAVGTTTLYAKWTEDTSYVAIPVADHPYPAATTDTEKVLGLPTWNNSKTQQGWDTYRSNDPAISVGEFTWAKYIVIVAEELNTLEFTWHNTGNGWVGGQKQFADDSISTDWLAGTDGVSVTYDDDTELYTATVELSKVLGNYAGFIGTNPEDDFVGLLFQNWDLEDAAAPNWTSNIKSVKLIIPPPED